jgi:hypothetical protein
VGIDVTLETAEAEPGVGEQQGRQALDGPAQALDVTVDTAPNEHGGVVRSVVPTGSLAMVHLREIR